MTDPTLKEEPPADYVELTQVCTIKVDLNTFDGETREERLQALKDYLEDDPGGAMEWFFDPDNIETSITKENAND